MDEPVSAQEPAKNGTSARCAQQGQPLGLWWVGVLGICASFGLLLTGNLRGFGYAVGITLLVLALLRVILPPRIVGALAVRSRWLDAGTLSVLGVASAVVTSTLRLG